MAKKKDDRPNMVEQFAEFKELKNIDKTTMISVLEESFRNVLAKMFGTDENLDVILNPDKGDVQIFQNLKIVPDGEVTNPNLEISLSDAHADNDPDAEVGEEHTKEIFFEKFGRRAILTLRQTLQSKILDLQKEAIYDKFKELEGELVSKSDCCDSSATISSRPCCWTTTKTSCCFPRAKASPATSSAKARPYAPLWQMWTTRTTIPRLPYRAPTRTSCAGSSSSKCLKYKTA